MILPTAEFDIEYVLAYWMTERMNIFWSRVSDSEPPFSADPIFQEYKFTNVYRVTDRVSQYLLRHVQYNENWSAEDLIFRTILFKHFNLPSTWEGLKEYIGEEPTLGNFDFNLYCEGIDYTARKYKTVYNVAYMTAWVRDSDRNKAHGYLRLFADSVFSGDFIHQAIKAKTYPELYNLVSKLPYVGSFLAYQYATDLNYSPVWRFPETDLCLATVGSKRGIEKLLGGNRPKRHSDVVAYYTQYQNILLETHGFYRDWTNLFGRPLQPIDMQNCFCELDKFLRVFRPLQRSADGSGKRIKVKFKQTVGKPYGLMFPTWWDIAEFNGKYTVR